ncbi:hypothetical protein V8E53_011673 [Lactarius tabidus]
MCCSGVKLKPSRLTPERQASSSVFCNTSVYPSLVARKVKTIYQCKDWNQSFSERIQLCLSTNEGKEFSGERGDAEARSVIKFDYMINEYNDKEKHPQISFRVKVQLDYPPTSIVDPLCHELLPGLQIHGDHSHECPRTLEHWQQRLSGFVTKSSHRKSQFDKRCTDHSTHIPYTDYCVKIQFPDWATPDAVPGPPTCFWKTQGLGRPLPKHGRHTDVGGPNAHAMKTRHPTNANKPPNKKFRETPAKASISKGKHKSPDEDDTGSHTPRRASISSRGKHSISSFDRTGVIAHVRTCTLAQSQSDVHRDRSHTLVACEELSSPVSWRSIRLTTFGNLCCVLTDEPGLAANRGVAVLPNEQDLLNRGTTSLFKDQTRLAKTEDDAWTAVE